MLELETKFFGKKSIQENEILYFPEGLLGFPEVKKFYLFKENPDSPFLWLQSVEKKELAFVVMNPHDIVKNYQPVVLSFDLEALEVKSLEECSVFCILTIPENHPEEMTINLQGPVLINKAKKIGKQVISLDDRHKVRMNVFELIQKQTL
ncbi:MAG: flagellar assembly protein FliW [Leptospiraceae bacterium]|nr:flagellar assembly protein FliW [Leptospiraceae bacterium]MDW7976168.1 flagellar assembly protein FliW [Leptospiraceae bacterium]